MITESLPPPILDDELVPAELSINKVHVTRKHPHWRIPGAIFTSRLTILMAFDEENVPFTYTLYYAGVKEPAGKPDYFKNSGDKGRRWGSRRKEVRKEEGGVNTNTRREVVLLGKLREGLSEWELSTIRGIINGTLADGTYRVALVTKKYSTTEKKYTSVGSWKKG